MVGAGAKGEDAKERDDPDANWGGVAEFALRGERQPQVGQEQPQPQGQDQEFVTEELGVHGENWTRVEGSVVETCSKPKRQGTAGLRNPGVTGPGDAVCGAL